MTLLERIDSKLDPMFVKFGPAFYRAFWFLTAVIVPVLLFYMVLFGTKQLGPNSYEIQMPMVPILWIFVIIGAISQRYMMRLYRTQINMSLRAYVVGCVLSVAALALALPGMPLNDHWHAPTSSLWFTIGFVTFFYTLGFIADKQASKRHVQKTFKDI